LVDHSRLGPLQQNLCFDPPQGVDASVARQNTIFMIATILHQQGKKLNQGCGCLVKELQQESTKCRHCHHDQHHHLELVSLPN
jgi:hypothetical protein